MGRKYLTPHVEVSYCNPVAAFSRLLYIFVSVWFVSNQFRFDWISYALDYTFFLSGVNRAKSCRSTIGFEQNIIRKN